MSEAGEPVPVAGKPGEGRRLAGIGLIVSVVQSLRSAIAPAIGAFFVMRDESWALLGALGIGLLVAAIGGTIAYIRWNRTRYFIGHDDVRLESGVFGREARSIPYERIQDVSLEQKLLPRLFGLVGVTFETGAGGGDDLALQFVTEAEGERLREVVRARGEEATAPADEAGETRQIAEPEPIFAMGPKRLFTYGMFEFSLVIFAVLLGLVQQFDWLLPFNLWDQDGWSSFWIDSGGRDVLRGALREGGTAIEAYSRAAQVAGAVAALFGVIVLGVATGIARTFAREWDFRLDRTPKGFRRRRGLFTKTDVVMPVHRVQAAQVGTRWLRRRFGWHGLKFVSLAQDAGASSHVVAPFARLDEIWPLAREAGIAPPPADAIWQRHSRKAFVDGALLPLLVIVPVALGVGIAVSPWLGLFVALGSFAIVALGSFVAYRRYAFHLGPDQIYLREGLLAPKLLTGPRIKLHSAEIAMGPLARLRGYCTLHFGLGGGTMSLAGIATEDAERLRAAVLDSIADSDFSDVLERGEAA